MPLRRSCFRARCSSIRFMVLLLDFEVDQVAVLGQFTYQRIDLTKRQRQQKHKITADEAVFVDKEFEGGRAGILDRSDAKLLCQGEHSENAPNAGLTLMLMESFAEDADLRAGTSG